MFLKFSHFSIRFPILYFSIHFSHETSWNFHFFRPTPWGEAQEAGSADCVPAGGWRHHFLKMAVSENRGTPSHHPLIDGIFGFSLINHPAMGVPPWLWKPPNGCVWKLGIWDSCPDCWGFVSPKQPYICWRWYPHLVGWCWDTNPCENWVWWSHIAMDFITTFNGYLSTESAFNGHFQ